MVATISDFTRFQQLTSVRFSTLETENIGGIYFNGPTNNGVGATLTANTVGPLAIDLGSPETNDSVLLIGQTNAETNGIYKVIEPGSSTSLWVLRRREDFQCIEQVRAGYYVTVEDGFNNAGSVYTIIRPVPGKFGIDPLFFKSADQDSQPVSSILARTISFLGGNASFSIALTGIKTSSVVVAAIESSANDVSILKVNAGTDQVDFLCSGDPGAGFMNIIAFKDPQ